MLTLLLRSPLVEIVSLIGTLIKRLPGVEDIHGQTALLHAASFLVVPLQLLVGQVARLTTVER